MTSLADFHFLRPWWLLALFALPLVWALTRRLKARAGAWRGVVDARLLPYLLEAGPVQGLGIAPWLAALGFLVACLALAGPAWERESAPLYRNDAARVIALELAPTMLAADLKPTRLVRARHKINDILDASRDLQTALIGYSGDAFVAAPLTDDVDTVRNLVEALDPAVMPAVGNAPERAIAEAQRLVEQAGLQSGEIILLADAAGPAGIEAARAAHAKGFTVSVLGVGTNAGAPVPLPRGGFLQDSAGNIVLPRLDDGALRALAEAGGGRYVALSADRSDLDVLLTDLRGTGAASKDDNGDAITERYRDRGPWFALALLPLALLAFRRGWVVVLVLAFAPVPKAQAFEWRDLWQRRDQQAAAALAEGDAARAKELARDPSLRGSAAYRGDDYEAAAEAFATAQGADAEYNRGNALAKLGRYDDALAAYDNALAADPTLEDAQANRAAVEDWLKREQKNPDQKQKGDKQDGKRQEGKQQDGQQQDGQQQDGQQQDGQQQDGQQQDGQQQDGQQQDGQQQDGQQQDGQQQDGQQQDGQQQDGQQQDGQQHGDKQDRQQQDGQQQDGQQSAADPTQQQRDQDRQALTQAIDQALGEKAGDKGEVPAAATSEEESAREQQQALNQWLQRVPDDPGGLLRRKFQLEYERRQRGGGG